jgi:hypothetical protein
MKDVHASTVPPNDFVSAKIRRAICPGTQPRLAQMGMVMAGAALAITTSVSAGIVFSDDFSSGNLNNWAATGTWEVTTTGTQKYAHGLSADNSGSLTHAFGYVDSSWTVGLKYDFEWSGDVYNGDPRLTLGVDLLNDANNGYRVLLREGTWGEPLIYSSLQIYSVTAGTASSTPLASGQGFSIGGWQTIGATSPNWKSVTFTWDSLTGGLTANTNSPYGTPCSVTNASYTTFTKLRLVGTTLNKEGIDVDNVSVSVVPEPTALALLGCGLLVLYRRKK